MKVIARGPKGADRTADLILALLPRDAGGVGAKAKAAAEGQLEPATIKATATIEATDHHLNQHGTVHGGVLASLADAAMGAAVASDGQTPVTVEMKVTYLEPARAGTITASARVLRRGRRIIIIEAEVTDADGDAVAHAIATFTPV